MPSSRPRSTCSPRPPRSATPAPSTWRTLEEAREAGQTGFARLPWALVGDAGEEELAKSAITVRCIQRPDGTVPASEDEDDLVALVARSY